MRTFQLTDPVLGADAAAKLAHDAQHRGFDVAAARQEQRVIPVSRNAEVEVQVAIAGVPVSDEARVRNNRERVTSGPFLSAGGCSGAVEQGNVTG